MKEILIETDIGQDPDDLFALLYLLSADVDIKAIVLSPGDKFQIAITRFLLKECGKEDIPIGVSSKCGGLQRKTRFHYSVLDKYGYSHEDNPDSEFVCTVKETGEKSVIKAPDMPFGTSLLWDQCKECGIKEY